MASTQKRGHHKSVIHEKIDWLTIEEQGVCCVETKRTWMDSFLEYLKEDRLPNDVTQAKKLIKEASKYTLVGERLYKRGFSFPLLKCLDEEESELLLADIDCIEYVKKFDNCQRFAKIGKAPPEQLHSVISPWLFHKWGVDILGPFPTTPGQINYLIVAVDYFTKWVEAEPIATTRQKELSVFTRGKHPQSNGQAEVANKVILRGLRRRLEEAKGRWVEELPQVLWSYHTTPHSTTNETPFRLTFETEVMIPIEIGEPSRVPPYSNQVRKKKSYGQTAIYYKRPVK
ncbi:hypothetical protein CR513_18938, partial [Mucuna pruriens]